MKKNKSIEIFFVVLILGILGALAQYGTYHTSEKLDKLPPIRSDGAGYYAYLPAIFIDHNFEMKTAGQYKHDPYCGMKPYPSTGKLLDKYPVGVALLQTPFFLVAHIIAIQFDFKPLGYSLPYQIANIISALFYMCLGAGFLYACIREKYTRRISLISITLIFFGTNLFHYATYDGFLSHIYTFSMMSMYLWMLLQYQENNFNVLSMWFGLVLGLITMLRIPNAFVGFILLGLMIQKHTLLKFNIFAFLKEIMLVGLVYFITILPQLVYWYLITGKLIVYSYQGEFFNWMHPEIINFLFSVNKGLFFWSPVILISVLSFPFFILKNKLLGSLFFIAILLEIYICSSWNCWWFGGSFGCRPFVDMLPFLALPLAAGIEKLLEKINSSIIILFFSFLIMLNLTLMYAYGRNYLPDGNVSWVSFKVLPEKIIGKRNWEKYFSFLASKDL